MIGSKGAIKIDIACLVTRSGRLMLLVGGGRIDPFLELVPKEESRIRSLDSVGVVVER